MPADHDPATSPHPARGQRVALALGAIGLAGATLSDAIAVAGRHLGLHLLGSIEVTQAAIVLLASGALLTATWDNHHAGVNMLTARLSQTLARRMARAASLLFAMVFLILAAGTAWVAADMWHGYEQTEILKIPVRVLRLLWLGTTLTAAFVLALRAFREDPQ